MPSVLDRYKPSAAWNSSGGTGSSNSSSRGSMGSASERGHYQTAAPTTSHGNSSSRSRPRANAHSTKRNVIKTAQPIIKNSTHVAPLGDSMKSNKSPSPQKKSRGGGAVRKPTSHDINDGRYEASAHEEMPQGRGGSSSKRSKTQREVDLHDMVLTLKAQMEEETRKKKELKNRFRSLDKENQTLREQLDQTKQELGSTREAQATQKEQFQQQLLQQQMQLSQQQAAGAARSPYKSASASRSAAAVDDEESILRDRKRRLENQSLIARPLWDHIQKANRTFDIRNQCFITGKPHFELSFPKTFKRADTLNARDKADKIAAEREAANYEAQEAKVQEEARKAASALAKQNKPSQESADLLEKKRLRAAAFPNP